MSDTPASAAIALAAGDASTGLTGTFTYGGTAGPTATVDSSGDLLLMESAAATSMPQYVGAGIYINGNTAGTDCVNASTYTGVKFTISGTLSTACQLQFSIVDSEHGAYSSTNIKASGTNADYPASVPIPVTATPTETSVTFASLATGGMPVAAIDASKIVGLQWQYAIAAGTGTCTSSVTITGISFY